MPSLKNAKHELTPGRVKVACICCGVSIIRNRKHVERENGGPFCSLSCSAKFKSRGTANPNYRGGPITKRCAVCHADFQTPQHTVGYAKYCSNACRRLGQVGRPSSRRLPDATCPTCGELFRPGKRTRIHCSLPCKNKAQVEKVSGERSGAYVHGMAAKAYPTAWGAPLKRVIRTRDGNKCMYCLMPRSDHGKRDLCVHHIDYVKENLDHGNLITLCKICHGMMHGKKPVRAIWQVILTDEVRRAGA